MTTAWWFMRRLALAGLAVVGLFLFLFIYAHAQDNGLALLISPDATKADIVRAEVAFGTDQPLWSQFPLFLDGLLDGVLGRSFIYDASAARLVLGRMPATLELVMISLALAVLLGVPLGIWSARRPRAKIPRLLSAFSLFGHSIPVFWLGLMLLAVFAVQLGLLPAAGRGETVKLGGIAVSFLTRDGWLHLLLPVLTLAIGNLAMVLRLAKQTRIPNVLMISYLELGHAIAGAVVIENIFAWPGIGKLTIDSVNVLDRPVIFAALVLALSIVFALNLTTALVQRIFKVEDATTAAGPLIAGNKLAALGGLGLLALVILAALAARLALQNPYEPAGFNITDASLPPYAFSADGAAYWLGTDSDGRDLLSAILYGLRISLLIGCGSVLIAALLGTTLGAMAALIGGAVEAVIGWVGAVQIALPATLVTLLLLAFTTRRISYVVLALVLLQWPRHALIAHQAVVNHSAVSWWRGLLKSFPALALAQLAGAIALEATLSFLGLGLPNTMPSLGVMIANGTDDLLHGRFWTTFWPGLALVALVITSNLVAWRLEMPVCRDLQRGG